MGFKKTGDVKPIGKPIDLNGSRRNEQSKKDKKSNEKNKKDK